MGREQEARSELTADRNKTQEQVNAAENNTSSTSEQRQSFHPRDSFESIATMLPSYSEQSAPPPSYSHSSSSSRQKRTVADFVPRATPNNASNPPHGVSAASISAVMATSSSENDKMHLKGSKKVDDWNEDSTFKSRLAKLNNGSGRNWNYFGADIEQYGNPFKRLGRKK